MVVRHQLDRDHPVTTAIERLFAVEDWPAREGHGDDHDATAPPAAGGAV